MPRARGRAARCNVITPLFSCVLVVLGVAIVVRTATLGGGIGYLLGVMFVAAGALRLWAHTRQ